MHLKGLYATDTENKVSSSHYSHLKKINFRPQVIFLNKIRDNITPYINNQTPTRLTTVFLL